MPVSGRTVPTRGGAVATLAVATLLGVPLQTTASATIARAGPVAPAVVDAHIERAAAALARRLDPRVAATLERIDGLGPRLLALRSYLRAGTALQQRWSWTDTQIAEFEGSASQHALDAEIGKVRTAFETANPGFTLWVNPQVRSLELQLERWNTNGSVATAGAALLDDARRAVTAAHSGFRNDAERAGSALEMFLQAHVPTTPAALAAPGLSPHGRMGAVDFHVRQGERTVAAPDTGQVTSVWDAQGWRERLHVAVRNAGARFHGPLAVPDEPWHYEYRPEAGVLAEQ